MAAASGAADEVHRAVGSKRPNLLRVEPVERHVVGEVDVHLAELGGSADVDEREFLAAAAKIGERGGGNRGDHETSSVEQKGLESGVELS